MVSLVFQYHITNLQIRNAVHTLTAPKICRDENEQGSRGKTNVWCWACEKEVERDQQIHSLIMEHAGFLHHLAR